MEAKKEKVENRVRTPRNSSCIIHATRGNMSPSPLFSCFMNLPSLFSTAIRLLPKAVAHFFRYLESTETGSRLVKVLSSARTNTNYRLLRPTPRFVSQRLFPNNIIFCMWQPSVCNTKSITVIITLDGILNLFQLLSMREMSLITA